jgi:hypothetical protein
MLRPGPAINRGTSMAMTPDELRNWAAGLRPDFAAGFEAGMGAVENRQRWHRLPVGPELAAAMTVVVIVAGLVAEAWDQGEQWTDGWTAE